MVQLMVTQALFKLDDSNDPGQAQVKVLQRLGTAQAKAIKKWTGYDLYRVEIIEVTKPSSCAANPKPGQKKSVSEKHLTFQR